MPAEDFFNTYGPEEFPAAAEMAVQSSGQSPHGPPSTIIEAHGTLAAPLQALPPAMPLDSGGPGFGLSTLSPRAPLPMAPVRPPAPAAGRFEPYPGGNTQPTFGTVAPLVPPSSYGLEDEEI